MNEILIERTSQLCKSSGITLTQLELEIGLSRGMIKRWNKSSPSTDKILKISDRFNVSVDYLLGKSDIPHSVEQIVFNYINRVDR